MTTIRKIVTSKIDGNNANNTSTNEIRPFGELAVYIDTDNPNDPNKLELLMFDGVRTHLRSKVLSKGTFYGGDADSADQGDGIENLDTIKLIPDAELHYNDGNHDNDQYIVIDPTLPNHIHVRAGGAIDSSTATLFLGGEQNNVMVSDSADQVSITTNDTHTWLFGTDGKLTVPANSSILTNETALKIATHPTTTYTFNQAYWEALNGDITRVVTPTGNAQYFSCTVTANQDGTYTVGGTTGNSFAPGNWFKVPGNELGGVTPANDIQINIATVDGEGVILTTTITGTAVGKQWQFGTNGGLTLPGAVVNSTVAKTGVILPTTTGVVNGLTHDSVLTGLTDNTYGPFTLSGVTFSVFVFAGVINSAQSISSTGTATVNDVLGTIDSGVIGGTAGTTITWTVDTVVQETPTAIDLTKSVNKLTDGSYTLANGVEGQIMYIVRQNGSTAANIFVEVASARWDGSVYSDQPVIPFQIPFTDMVTIIFTDGAWQSSTFGSLT